MVRFNKYNAGVLLSRLFLKDEDGVFYAMYKDSAPINDVLDEEAFAFFERIFSDSEIFQSSEKTAEAEA